MPTSVPGTSSREALRNPGPPSFAPPASAGAGLRGPGVSARSSCRAPSVCARGFTLVEILVVVAILAIGGAIAAATLSGDERTSLSREARRFAGAVEYAADRAKVRHETLGVSADGEAWRFWRRSAEGRWSALSDDPALAPRVLPSPLRALPHDYAGGPLRPDAIVPLRASGRNEPFSFVLTSEQHQAVVSVDPLSRVAVGNAEPFGR